MPHQSHLGRPSNYIRYFIAKIGSFCQMSKQFYCPAKCTDCFFFSITNPKVKFFVVSLILTENIVEEKELSKRQYIYITKNVNISRSNNIVTMSYNEVYNLCVFATLTIILKVFVFLECTRLVIVKVLRGGGRIFKGGGVRLWRPRNIP